ncbi:hypothetical protein HQQ94_12385 [Shewanella sp. VB17]|uniref:hypothetical protein n=1 Tax=Shewanella sp. VB17 TaxID=2739432 RepID=UPI001566E675|nr:hypothetical protein [Shewanella sp. VB17]NRD74020.1 hypothetical protein [Shewanella sp. VB17]
MRLSFDKIYQDITSGTALKTTEKPTEFELTLSNNKKYLVIINDAGEADSVTKMNNSDFNFITTGKHLIFYA